MTRRTVPTTQELLAAWRAEAAAAADPAVADRLCERLGDRFRAATPPWDLVALAREAAAGTTAVLVLDGVRGPGVAAGLDGLGVTVVRHDGAEPGDLPYPERCVDVVVVRDRAFDAEEAARVLRPGGMLLVEERAVDDLRELHAVLGATVPHPRRRRDATTAGLLDAGLHVARDEEWRGPVEVADVGALVAWLVAEPERAPADFSVDGYLNTLHYLHMRGPAWGQPLVFTQSRHLLVAERPL